MADKESEIFNATGDRMKIPGTSIKPATKLERGTVKQAGSEICYTEQNSKYEYQDGQYFPNDDKRYNDAIKSRRAAGQAQNTEFVVILDLNMMNADYDAPHDMRVFHAGDTVTLRMSDKYIPTASGATFKGWALTPDATVPTYPYDEQDPQDYTLTFGNDDITLYGVWEEKFVTITYHLGQYGQGSVPAAQTVREGEEVEISFSPAPTVNDGSGRVFVGWGYGDGYQTVSEAAFKQGETEYVSVYSDLELYPVFVAQYTLTYALGNDATGTVPSPQTAYSGEELVIDFNPSVTCINDPTKVFIGWAYSDESGYTDFSTDGPTEIYMNGNITLYPVFGSQAVGDTLTIDNSDGREPIRVTYHDSDLKEDIEVMTIAAGDTGTLNVDPNLHYNIEFVETEGTVMRLADFTGTFDGTSYSSETLSINAGPYWILNPSGSDTYWDGYKGISGTLTTSSN